MYILICFYLAEHYSRTNWTCFLIDGWYVFLVFPLHRLHRRHKGIHSVAFQWHTYHRFWIVTRPNCFPKQILQDFRGYIKCMQIKIDLPISFPIKIRKLILCLKI